MKSVAGATRILTLRICAQGFAKLASGQIQIKYRPATVYWQRRLLQPDGQPRQFDAIYIRNGYRPDSPLAIFAFGGIDKVPQEHQGQSCYLIHLGALLALHHYPPISAKP